MFPSPPPTLQNPTKYEPLSTPTTSNPPIPKCNICLDPYTNPYRLQCKHTYCKECLVQYVTSKVVVKEVPQ